MNAYALTLKADHINGVIPLISGALISCPFAMRYAAIDV